MKSQAQIASEIGCTPGSLSKLQKNIRENGWGTKAQRNYADSQGMFICAVPKQERNKNEDANHGA